RKQPAARLIQVGARLRVACGCRCEIGIGDIDSFFEFAQDRIAVQGPPVIARRLVRGCCDRPWPVLLECRRDRQIRALILRRQRTSAAGDQPCGGCDGEYVMFHRAGIAEWGEAAVAFVTSVAATRLLAASGRTISPSTSQSGGLS